MSRRFRVEEERKTKVIEEDDFEEDDFIVQQRRINFPLVWKKTSQGIRIQDLKEKYYDEVLDIIKEYYLPNDVLSKNTNLVEDEESLECYLQRILFQLKDCFSIIAVDESNYVFDENEEEEKSKKEVQKPYEQGKIKIVGVLMLKVMFKNDLNRVFSSMKITNGEAMKKCMDIKIALDTDVDIFEIFDCESYLRYYELCVIPDYRSRGIGYQLINAGLCVARSFELPVVAGIFTNYAIQRLVRRLGMRVVKEISYVRWINKERELIFDDPGPGNYTCALMAGPVMPPLPPPPSPQLTPLELALIPKIPRAEKQAKLSKKIVSKNPN